ncbi:MAG: hypothetical protein JW746_08520 [Candidatus Krumholzibacteriota bacterium]|nr:hypothetical protein [Candidatus Krumholzibacteriota bacterium]
MRIEILKENRLLAVLIFVMIITAAAENLAAKGADPDSTVNFRCSAVYTNRVMLLKNSSPFPWNDPETESHLNDRISLLFQVIPWKDTMLLLKGASGERSLDDEGYRNRMILEQGDIRYALRDGRMNFRLFMRERVFRTRNRTLNLMSDDLPEISGNGQGVKLEARAVKGVNISVTSADFFERSQLEKSGGLPIFNGAPEEVDLVEIETSRDFWHIGLMLAESRSASAGNISLAGGTMGTGIGNTRLSVEFAKSVSGRLKELGDSRFLDIAGSDIRFGRVSRGLPDDMEIGTEVTGFECRVDGIGRFGVVPSYRYCGKRFLWNKGESSPGIIESSILSWWKHQDLSVSAQLEFCDSYSSLLYESYRAISGTLRMEFKEGFESIEKIIISEDKRSTLILSLLDDRYGSRVRLLTRLDDAGGTNHLSFLAEGSIDLDRSWSLRSSLFHQRSGENLYGMELEFRPKDRFLFRAGFGSYNPSNEASSIFHDQVPRFFEKERMISFYTRIWFGEMID